MSSQRTSSPAERNGGANAGPGGAELLKLRTGVEWGGWGGGRAVFVLFEASRNQPWAAWTLPRALHQSCRSCLTRQGGAAELSNVGSSHFPSQPLKLLYQFSHSKISLRLWRAGEVEVGCGLHPGQTVRISQGLMEGHRASHYLGNQWLLWFLARNNSSLGLMVLPSALAP